jgi:hypothetical protein
MLRELIPILVWHFTATDITSVHCHKNKLSLARKLLNNLQDTVTTLTKYSLPPAGALLAISSTKPPLSPPPSPRLGQYIKADPPQMDP